MSLPVVLNDILDIVCDLLGLVGAAAKWFVRIIFYTLLATLAVFGLIGLCEKFNINIQALEPMMVMGLGLAWSAILFLPFWAAERWAELSPAARRRIAGINLIILSGVVLTYCFAFESPNDQVRRGLLGLYTVLIVVNVLPFTDTKGWVNRARKITEYAIPISIIGLTIIAATPVGIKKKAAASDMADTLSGVEWPTQIKHFHFDGSDLINDDSKEVVLVFPKGIPQLGWDRGLAKELRLFRLGNQSQPKDPQTNDPLKVIANKDDLSDFMVLKQHELAENSKQSTPSPAEPEPAKVVQAKAPAKTEKVEKVIAPIPAPPPEPTKPLDPPPPPPVKLFNEGEVVVKTLGQVKEYEPYRMSDDIVLTRLAGDMQYRQVPLVPERTLIRFEITSAEEVGGKKDTYLLSLSPRQLIVFDDSGKPDSHVFPENVTAGQLTAKKPGKLSKIANIFKRPEVVGPTAGAIIGGVAGGGKGAAEGAIIGLGAGLVLKYGTPYGAMTHGAPVEIPAQQEIRFAIR